jgi:hypothetical protein
MHPGPESGEQGFFQDFLLGPFLQRRLSLAEQLGVWGSCGKSDTCSRLYPISVVETQCAKADTINWLKMGNALFFLCCEMNSSHFFLIVGFPTETNFHTSPI